MTMAQTHFGLAYTSLPRASSHLVGEDRPPAEPRAPTAQSGANRAFISWLKPVPKKTRGVQPKACWKAR